MEIIKTIDVKGKSHSEKEKTIFTSLEELEIDQTLRIIVEFNPLPLVFLLKARREFEISYEKKGPPEWVLNVKRIAAKASDKQRIKELLKELKGGAVSLETKLKAKKILQQLDAKTLGMVEQEIIKEGISRDEIRKSLCDIHLDVLKDTLVSQRIEVSSPHPIHTFMREHQVILNTLNELRRLLDRLKDKHSYDQFRDDEQKLKDIAHNLIEAESHHKREEDVLFPKLIKHDIIEPPEIMKMDHVELRKRKHALQEIANAHENYKFDEFKNRVLESGNFLTQELESHIFKEDNILYQMALQVLTGQDWDDVKKQCDQIGYCSFTPKD